MQPSQTILASFTLHALLFIAATVTAGVCLIGIWAGISRRHWFLRTASVLAVSLLCLPIRAYGPAIYFFLLMVSLAAVVRLLRRYGWFAVPEDIAANRHQKQPRRFRFALVDLFLATTVVGLATIAILPLLRSRIILGPIFIVGTLPLIACAATTGAMLLEARTPRGRLMVAVVLAAACAAHVVLQYWRFGYWIFEFVDGGGEYWELVTAHVLLSFEFLAIVIVGR